MAINHDSISYPPRGLNREESARWIGVSPSKFDELVKDGRMPRPHKIDARKVWDRLKLDAAFSDLPTDSTKNRIDELLGA